VDEDCKTSGGAHKALLIRTHLNPQITMNANNHRAKIYLDACYRGGLKLQVKNGIGPPGTKRGGPADRVRLRCGTEVPRPIRLPRMY
jgi:hypothetical protein